MAMPTDLILVRHGQSEANVVQHAEKNGLIHEMSQEVYGRPDFEQPLSQEGVSQATEAGEWLRQHGIDPMVFDERYVSPFYRTMQTAQYLGGTACDWLPEVRLIERDWGVYGATPLSERMKRFEETERQRTRSSFFTRLDGGESISDVVYRFRDFLGTLAREMPDKRVLAVTHGELMWAARFVLERMLPQEWQELDRDRGMRIGNCCILWYSRVNPNNPRDISESLTGGWRRMINPLDEATSPYGGEWQKLPGKRRLTGGQIAELLTRKETEILVEAARESF